MNEETLMMDITLPCGTTKTSGRYPAAQIRAWVERVRVEHQLSQTKRVLREPTSEEMNLPVQDNIFRVK